MQDRPTFGALSKPRSLSLCSVTTATQSFSEIKFRNKKSVFWFMEKHLSYTFHIWKNAYHKDFIQFLYVWKCMKLYDKKFLIYESCMIRSFGQPGFLVEILEFTHLNLHQYIFSSFSCAASVFSPVFKARAVHCRAKRTHAGKICSRIRSIQFSTANQNNREPYLEYYFIKHA